MPKRVMFFLGLAVEVGGGLGCEMDSNDLWALAFVLSCRVKVTVFRLFLAVSAGTSLGVFSTRILLRWGERCQRAPALSPWWFPRGWGW